MQSKSFQHCVVDLNMLHSHHDRCTHWKQWFLITMPELRERIPSDKVDLRLLLVGGQSHNFLFPTSASGRDIVQHVFENWPSEWSESSSCIAKPDNSQVLRLLYRGRFLGQSTTLASLSLPVGKTTVLHLLIRETITDNQHHGQSGSQTKATDHMHSRCCTIL